MENKFLKIYLTIFMLVVFLTSALFIYELIGKLNLPKGIISAIVNYGYFIVHLSSFMGILYYGKDFFVDANKNDLGKGE